MYHRGSRWKSIVVPRAIGRRAFKFWRGRHCDNGFARNFDPQKTQRDAEKSCHSDSNTCDAGRHSSSNCTSVIAAPLADKHTSSDSSNASSLFAAPSSEPSVLARVWHHRWPRVLRCDTTCVACMSRRVMCACAWGMWIRHVASMYVSGLCAAILWHHLRTNYITWCHVWMRMRGLSWEWVMVHACMFQHPAEISYHTTCTCCQHEWVMSLLNGVSVQSRRVR